MQCKQFEAREIRACNGNGRRIVCGLGWYLMRRYRATFQTQLAHFPSKNCDTAKDTEENAEEWRNKWKISIFKKKR